MKKLVLLLGIASCAMLSGCGSIIHGSTERVGFTSEPAGAKVTVGGVTTVTPAFITLDRRGKHEAHFSMEGYEPAVVPLKEGMSMWFLVGNLGFGGIPGWIIDACNGSIGDLSPDNVHVNLVKKEPSATDTPVAATKDVKADTKKVQ